MAKFRVPRLGELLVRAGFVVTARVDEALAIQEDLREGRVETAQRIADRLGTILLNSAAVSGAQLERALAEQAQTGGLLGEVLVRQGAITPEQRQGALRIQGGLAGRLQGRFLIGRLLADAGVITEAALESAIRRQLGSGKPLGELLVDAGQLTATTLYEFLERQTRLRAALLAGASLATETGPKDAGES